jgi:hypothetical protein
MYPAEPQRGKRKEPWRRGCFSQRLSVSAGEKALVAFAGCSSSAGEKQKKYRAVTQGRRGEKKKEALAQRMLFSAPQRLSGRKGLGVSVDPYPTPYLGG